MKVAGDSMDCSPPDSTVHGILQGRILEWVATPSFREFFLTQGSKLHVSCLLHSLPSVPPGPNPRHLKSVALKELERL